MVHPYVSVKGHRKIRPTELVWKHQDPQTSSLILQPCCFSKCAKRANLLQFNLYFQRPSLRAKCLRHPKVRVIRVHEVQWTLIKRRGIFGARISVKARKQYFANLLQQDVGYYDEKNSGAINTELISDCLYIAGMGTAIGLVVQHTFTFVGSFVLAF